MYDIVDEIIKEAYNKEIKIDNKIYDIAFNTKLDDKEFINNNKYPTLIIKNYDEFIKKIEEYIRVFLKSNIVLPTFISNKEKNLIKLLISFLFCNAEGVEFKDPIELIKKRINFLTDNTFSNLNIELDGLFEESQIIVNNIKSSITDYSFNKINISLILKDDKYIFPSIYYGISNNICYIYSVSNITKTSDAFTKKINRQLYKLNKNIDKELLDVSPNVILSLTIFFELLKKKKINEISFISDLPIRFNANELKIAKIEQEKKKLLNNRDKFIDNKNQISKTINRMNKHINIIKTNDNNDNIVTLDFNNERIVNNILKTISENVNKKSLH